MGFIIISFDNFSNYMKVLCNNAIYIPNYQFLNPIRQIIYFCNTQKIVEKVLLK